MQLDLVYSNALLDQTGPLVSTLFDNPSRLMEAKIHRD